MLKHICTLLLLGAIPAFLIGQHQDMLVWEDNGVPIRQGKHVEWFRSGFPSDSGSVMYTWSDTRNGDRDVFTQKIDRDGNQLWGDDGTNVIRYADRQEDPVLVTDGHDGAIILWVDFRADSTGDIYAQRIDSLGNKVWDEDGVPIATRPKTQISLRMAEDDNGGAFAAWLDSRNGGSADIYGIHINGDGTVNSGWAENGNPISIAGGDQFQHSLDKDGAGNAIIVWSDTRDGADQNVYGQRLLQDGTMDWAEDGQVISDGAEEQTTPKLVYTGGEGVYVVWRDQSVDANGDIIGQRLNTDGTPAWNPAGVTICDLDNKQVNPRVTADADSNFFVTWEDFRNDPVNADIYAQSLDYGGNVRWQVDGAVATMSAGGQEEPRVTPDGQGGCYIVWTDYRDGGFPQNDIYLQRIASDGTTALASDGQPVVDAIYAQNRPLIRPDGQNGAIVAWGDARTGSIAIYVQRIQANGNTVWQGNGFNLYSGIDGDARYPQITLGESNELVTFWEDHRKGANVYAQRLGEDAAPLSELNGKAMSSIDSLRQFVPVIEHLITDTDEYFYVAWEDGTSEREVRVQRLNSSFDSQWAEEGISVENAISESTRPGLALTPDGGIIVGWSDIRSLFSNDIYVQKYNTAGEAQWADDGLLIGELDGDNLLEGMHAVDEGVYVVWQGGDFEDLNIYVHMIDYEGNPVSGWEDGPFPVVEAENHQTNPVLAPGESNNLFVLWEDRRNGDADVYMNEITPTGVTLEDGMLVLGGTSDQNAPSGDLYNNGLLVAAQDFSNGADFDIKYQKVNTTDFTLDGDAEYLVQHTGNQSAVDVARLSDGTLLTAWTDDRNGVDTDIYAQWLDANGRWHLWNDEGVVICDALHKQNVPQILPHGSNGAYIVWEDNRSSGKTELFNLYGARLTDMTSGTEEPGTLLPLDFTVEQNYPNPFNPATTIPYSLDGPGEVQFAIFNLRGQKIWQASKTHTGAGRYQITWNGKTTSGREIASGTYFLRVTHNEKVITRKLIAIE